MVFEITNFDDIALDASIIEKLESETTPGVIDEDKLTRIFASGIIHATISDVILELMTGEEAFITVPYFEEDNITEVRYTEDELNYISVDELKAVLRALHALNITDFENVEASLDINSILENVDLLLESAVLQATISKQLLEMSDTIVVPETYFGGLDIQIEVGDVFEGTNTTYIYSLELENIFDALSVLNIEDINSIQMDATIINNLEDTDDEDEDLITEELSQSKLDTLFSSAIIHATLSDVLLELMTGDDNFVVVPHYGLDDFNDEYEVLQSYNTVQYISIAELSAALEALYALDITDFDTIETAITLQVILDNIDVLLASSILHATISKQLLDMNGGSVIIPVTSLDDEPIQIETGDVLLLTNTTYITRDELRNIFDALDILGISDIETVTFDATIINNLADTEDDDLDLITDELSDAKLATLFSSSIIHATISDMLYDLTTGDEPFVVVPAFGLDESNDEIPIKTSAYTIDYVVIAELEAVLKALYALDITDFDTMEESLTLDVIIANIDILLDSSILHATVSKTLLDMSGDAIVIPYVDWDSNPVVVETGDVLLLTNTTYIIREELVNTFDALQVLGINDIDSFDGTVDLSVLSIEGNMEIMLSSIIIQATVSDQIFEQEIAGQLSVPYVKDDNTTLLRKTVGPIGHETEFILKLELEAIFDALIVLEIFDVGTFDGTVDLSVIAEDNNSSIILASSVIQATVTDQIIELSTDGTVTLPKYMEDNTTLIVMTVGEVGFESQYIPKTELEYLFDALDILGFTDVNGFTGTVDLSILAEGTNAHVVLSSAIVQATVSKQVLDLDTDGTISVPYFDETETINIRILTGSGLDAFEYIKATELEAMIFALDILGINNVETFDGTIELTNFFEEAGRNTLLASSIMHATISKQLLDLGANVLTIPYEAEDDVTVIRLTVGVIGYQTEYVAQIEIHAIFEALEILEITDINSFSGTISLDNFFEQPGQDKNENRNTLLASASMHATITKQLVDLDTAGTLVVPTLSQLGADIRIETGPIGFETEFVVKTEILAMFDALETLGINDINAFTGTVNLNNVYGDTNQDTILASASMHATITKQINDLGPSILIVPTTDVNGNAISSTVSGTFFLNKDEIKGLIDALELLGVTDIEGFDGSVSLTMLFASMTPEYDDNQEILLSSASMHATITKQIDDLGPSILVVPNTDVFDDEIKDSDFGTLFIYKDEIKSLINALDILGVGDITSFTGTVSLNAFLPSTSPLTYNTNQNTLLASASMHATITKQINDLGSSILLVPSTDVDSATIKDTVSGTLFIYKDEIKALINALDLLGVTDITTFTGTVSLNSIFGSESNQNTLLASASMHATISKQILDLGSSVLLVPATDVDNLAVREVVSLTDFVYKNEIKALINSLDILGINDITSFTGTVELDAIFGSEDNQNILLASASMHATISKQITDLGPSILVVPTTDVNNLSVRATVALTDYIYKNEIKALINALDILGINDITAFTGTVSLTSFFASVTPLEYDTNQNILLASASMHATITKQIDDLGSATLLVPLTDFDNNSIQATVSSNYFIFKNEIKALINALDILGVSDITNFTGGFSLTSLSGDSEQTTLLASASMHATISQKLFSQPDDVLIVPTYSQAGEVELNRIQKTVSLTDFIIKDEIKALINAFSAMGFMNLESFGTGIDSSAFFTNPDLILLSSSIQATFSYKMLNGTGGELIVPDTDAVTLEIIRIVQSDVTYIEIDEMKAIINALEILNLTNFDTMDFTPAAIFSADFDELLLSVSMQATISKNILSGALDQTAPVGSGSLIVPDYFRQAIMVNLVSDEQIEKVELKALLTALETLEISDFSGSMNASTVTNMDDAKLSTMLLSGSMHVTMDNMLKGNPNIAVPNKAYYGGNLTTPLYDINGLIQANEIKYFILAAKEIGSDFTNVDFSYSAIESLDAGQQTIVLTSMIVRNMITPDLVTAVDAYNDIPAFLGGPDPVLYDPIPDSFYEDNDNSTFLTSSAILTLIDYLPA